VRTRDVSEVQMMLLYKVPAAAAAGAIARMAPKWQGKGMLKQSRRQGVTSVVVAKVVTIPKQ
jgi:hypothetical protein